MLGDSWQLAAFIAQMRRKDDSYICVASRPLNRLLLPGLESQIVSVESELEFGGGRSNVANANEEGLGEHCEYDVFCICIGEELEARVTIKII